jgi:hypothetical protein
MPNVRDNAIEANRDFYPSRHRGCFKALWGFRGPRPSPEILMTMPNYRLRNVDQQGQPFRSGATSGRSSICLFHSQAIHQDSGVWLPLLLGSSLFARRLLSVSYLPKVGQGIVRLPERVGSPEI